MSRALRLLIDIAREEREVTLRSFAVDGDPKTITCTVALKWFRKLERGIALGEAALKEAKR